MGLLASNTDNSVHIHFPETLECEVSQPAPAEQLRYIEEMQKAAHASAASIIIKSTDDNAVNGAFVFWEGSTNLNRCGFNLNGKDYQFNVSDRDTKAIMDNPNKVKEYLIDLLSRRIAEILYPEVLRNSCSR